MILFLILMILFVILVIITVGVYYIAFHSPNKTQNDDFSISHSEQMDLVRDEIIEMIKATHQMPFERVETVSDDGLKLRGRYYHTKDGAPVVIGFHGYRGTPARDFSGGTQLYLQAGFNLLMIEQRSHCSSEGHTITFGVRERYDGLCWIRYVREHCGADTRIILAGISMGAATVLMMSGLDLPFSQLQTAFPTTPILAPSSFCSIPSCSR